MSPRDVSVGAALVGAAVTDAAVRAVVSVFRPIVLSHVGATILSRVDPRTADTEDELPSGLIRFLVGFSGNVLFAEASYLPP